LGREDGNSSFRRQIDENLRRAFCTPAQDEAQAEMPARLRDLLEQLRAQCRDSREGRDG
jgi:hypothetical protein